MTKTSKECIFPFVYKSNTYTRCTKAGGKDYWCATSVTSAKEYSDWDYCVFRRFFPYKWRLFQSIF